MSCREPFDFRCLVDFVTVSAVAILLGLPTVTLVDYIFQLIR